MRVGKVTLNIRILTSLAAVFLATIARADIYQWEYINPADPSQGKRQSTTLCPDGAGVNPAPNTYFDFENLTMAYLPGVDLSYCNFEDCNFTNADLRNINLSHSTMFDSTWSGADLTGANIQFANIGGTLSLAQIYSTLSYQQHDLSGAGFSGDLSGADFTNQNLTSVSFSDVQLNGADFRGANLAGTTFKYSTLDQANLSGLNLAATNFNQADLTSANLQHTDLRGATFYATSFAEADFTGAGSGCEPRPSTILQLLSFSGCFRWNRNHAGTALLDCQLPSKKPIEYPTR